MKKRGISVIENLISLTLFLILVLGALEILFISNKHFFKLKEDQETKSAARAALEKIKTDLRNCGLGFVDLPLPGIAQPISVENNTLILKHTMESFSLPEPLSSGQTTIPNITNITPKKGQEICFLDEEKGEILTVSSVTETTFTLASPLKNSYESNSTVFLIYKLTFYLDKSKAILRRKVNASPAQPLCEQVQSFECHIQPLTNMVRLRLSLKPFPENIHEISVFPKNAVLSNSR